MTGIRRTKRRSFSMRLSEADIDLIDRAAGLRGQSRTEFVHTAALRAADEVPLDQTRVLMSAPGFRAFAATLSRPPKVVPELVELFERRAPWERG